MSSTVARPKVKSVPSEAMVKTKRKPISKTKLLGRAVLIALVLSACAGVAAYLCFSLYYTRHFFPKTMINGIDASNQEVFEVREKIADEIEDYQLTVITKDGEEQVINGADIGLKAVFGDELVSLLASQNGLAWPAHVSEWEEKNVGTMVDWSADGLTEALSSLPCVQKANMVAPADAYLSEYTPGTGYTVVPEVEGSTINFDDLRYYAEKKIPVLEETLDLRDVDVYVKPTVYSTDETLNRRAEALNHYVNHTITYDMGENSMKLDGSRINDWITVTGVDTVRIDENAVRNYVAGVAEKVDTYGKPHEFKTSSGAVVTVEPCYFGWQMDQEAEFAQLMEDLKSGTDVTRQPIWSKEGKSFGAADFGDTYAEVNISAQHLYFYKNGELVLDSPVVTGCVQKDTTTPVGLYTVYSMETSRYLVGENYRSFVNYWMPFNGGVGFHDATWRGSFGGGIYYSSGSHGCVNLPLSVAKELYANMELGMPVIVYRLDSTATVSESTMAANCVSLINSASPVTLASEGAIRQARNIYNYLSAEGKAKVTNIDLLAAEEAELQNQKANAAAAAAAQEAAAQAAAQAAAEAEAAAAAAAAQAAALAAGQI